VFSDRDLPPFYPYRGIYPHALAKASAAAFWRPGAT